MIEKDLTATQICQQNKRYELYGNNIFNQYDYILNVLAKREMCSLKPFIVDISGFTDEQKQRLEEMIGVKDSRSL